MLVGARLSSLDGELLGESCATWRGRSDLDGAMAEYMLVPP